MATALNKHVLFGFQVQTTKGVQASDNIIWTPFSDTFDFNFRPNIEVFRQADNTDYEHLAYSRGHWWEGTAPVTIVPTAGTITELIDWIQTRDAYNQGKWASVYCLHRDVNVVKASYDVKVRRATLRLEKGNPAAFSLELAGLNTGTSPSVGTCATGGPYLWNEATIEQDLGAGSYSPTADMELIEITLDNNLEDPADGLRITSGNTPQQLYNVAGVSCTGRIERDFVDNSYHALYLNQADSNFSDTYDAALRITLTRGGVTITLELPRVKFTDWVANPSGTNEGRIREEITFVALGSDDGATAPIVLS